MYVYLANSGISAGTDAYTDDELASKWVPMESDRQGDEAIFW